MSFYGGIGYDNRRQALCQHILQNPDIAQAKDAHTESGDIDVVMRPGATDADILAFAKRMRQYMTQNYNGDDTYIVSNISIYHNISDAPYSKPDDPPISDPMGLMALVVTTGMGSTDSYMDGSWHTFKDGKVFE